MIYYDHKHLSDRRSRWACSTFRVQSKLASREKTGMPIAAKRQGTEAEVCLPFTLATSFTCRPTWLLTISCKSNASYDFKPIYEAPAGVINPYERAENEMSLNSNRWNSKENKKGCLLFLLFCFSSRRPRRRSGFYHVQFPLEKFSFSWRLHLRVVYLISVSFFKEVLSTATHVYQWYVT